MTPALLIAVTMTRPSVQAVVVLHGMRRKLMHMMEMVDVSLALPTVKHVLMIPLKRSPSALMVNAIQDMLRMMTLESVKSAQATAKPVNGPQHHHQSSAAPMVVKPDMV